MISDNWIGNLANWRWNTKKNEWDHKPQLQTQCIIKSIEKLIDLCIEGCSAFNQHAGPERQMGYMPGGQGTSVNFEAFALFLGRCDARLKLSEDTLSIVVATAEGYSRKIGFSQSFTAKPGDLAKAFWQRPDGFLYTEELLSMLMLEELVKTWWIYQGRSLERTKPRKDDAREYQL